MKQRGRKSAAQLAAVGSLNDHLPLPPDTMTPEQADLWKTTVGRLPYGYFPPETWEVLAAYCRHATTANMLSKDIDAWESSWLREDGGLERFERIVRMRDRETRAMLSCARSLRLTNQARYSAKSAATAANNAPLVLGKPWEPSEY